MNEDYQNFDTESSAQEQPQTEQPQSERPQSSAPETPQYNNEQTYQSYQTYQAYNPYQAQPQHSAPPQKKTPKKKHWGLRIAVVALCCALVGSAAGGAIVGSVMHTLHKNDVSMNQKPSESQTATTPSEPTTQVVQTKNPSTQLTPAEIYAQNVSAVVSISNQATTNVFGQVTSTASSGTGFVISSDGEILTNYHVVKNASKLTVTMNSGETYDATVIGYEEDSDVALIKINAENLATVQLGNSSALRVGDEVAAIGNPLGELTNTMTVGYVSALDRYINTDGSPINMMQIDAAINSGNSGGPLFNSHGEVIGIVSAKYSSGSNSSSASVEGLGFAIPMDDVASMVSDLVKNGYVTGKPIMGISVADVDESVTSYGVPQGAIIRVVTPDLCGAKAGLQAGDIVTKIDNTDVTSASDLTSAIGNYKPGDKVTLTIFRSGETKTVEVTLEESTPEKTEKQNQAQQEYQQEYQQSQQQQQQSQQQQQGSSGWPFGSFGY